MPHNHPLYSDPPRTKGCLLALLVLLMAAAWGLFVMPLLTTLVGTGWFGILLLGAGLLKVLDLSEDALVTGLFGAGLLTILVFLAWGIGWLFSVGRKGTRWAGPGCLALSLAVMALLTMVAVPLEAGGNGLFPDLFTALPILSILALLTAVAPLLVLYLGWKSARFVYRVASRRPFLAGAASAICGVLLAPLGLVGLAGLSALDTPPAATYAAPPAAMYAAPQQATASPDMEVLLRTLAALAEATKEATPPDPTVTCMEDLSRPVVGISEVDKVRLAVKRQYSLSDEDAEDVTMAALIGVCTSANLGSYQSLGAVFMQAAKNRANDLRYQTSRMYYHGSNEDFCSSYVPDETRLRAEVRLLQSALDTLDPTTQRALHLWAQGHTIREIASAMGITERKARDLVGNGVKKARKTVQASCPTPVTYVPSYQDWDDD